MGYLDSRTVCEAPMQQLSIGSGPAGTLLVAGNPDNPSPTVIQNVDAVNILYIGKEVSVNPAVPFECAPLYPGQTTIASGDTNIFGIADRGQTVAINVFEGMMSFFQPINLNNRTLLGGYFISGSGGGTTWQSAKPSTPGFYLYYDDGVNPPVLALSISIAPGSDQWGNTWPGGQQIVGLPTLTNVFTVIDTSGNTLASIDATGNITGQTINASTDVVIGGQSLTNDIIPELSLGLINRGWTPSGVWPSTPLGTGNAAIVELDQTLTAGRAYKVTVVPVDFIPNTAATQYVQQLRATTDGSTPSNASTVLRQGVIACSNANANHMTPYVDYIPGNLLADTLYRFLVTANVQTGTYQYQGSLEIRIEDEGLWSPQSNSNNGVAFGTGGGSGGGGSKQTFTKTYNSVEFASYYGSTASYGTGPNSQRSHNSNMYQGCSSGNLGGAGDQYSFARFNYGQIATDLGAGVVNWVKLRLTNQHSWYNSGCNAVVGWNNYTGAWGGTFVPGGGTHMNTDHYHINEGATLTHQMSGAFVASITSGFTSIVLGTSDSYTTNTDLNNYGYFAGAGSLSTCPQLQINYTK